MTLKFAVKLYLLLLLSITTCLGLAQGSPAIPANNPFSTAVDQSASAKKKDLPLELTGSAWPLFNGYVVTSFQAVFHKSRIQIILPNGNKMHARHAAVDQNNDLAILEVENNKFLPKALPLAQNEAESGTKVFTLGYASAQSKLNTASGFIHNPWGIHHDPRMMQITVPFTPGFGGSPLLDKKGEVVGVLVSELKQGSFRKMAITEPGNIYYAVKIRYLKQMLDSLPQEKMVDEYSSSRASLRKTSNRVQPSLLQVWAR